MATLKYKINDLVKHAKKLNGECLSRAYTGATEKHEWQCAKGHRWSAIWNSIRRGRWCPQCNKLNSSQRQRKIDFSAFEKLVKSRGTVLSKISSQEKISKKQLLQVQCSCGHTWSTSLERLNRGNWCKRCSSLQAGKSKLSSSALSIAKRIASERNGKLLSKKYEGAHTNLKWKCFRCKKTWEAKLSNVKNGTWCPNCSSNKSEKIVRIYFEKIFNEKFPKCRPDWLQGLELDGYSEKLRIAFEHQGDQHFEESRFFRQNLEDRIKADKKKKTICKKKGVTLIEIPQLNKKIHIKDLRNYIEKKSREQGITTSKKKLQTIDIEEAYKDNEISEIKAIIARKKGKVIEFIWPKVTIRCQQGHSWTTQTYLIKNDSWCRRCNSEKIKKESALKFRQKINDIASLKNGKILKIPANIDGNVVMLCSKGHKWSTGGRQLIYKKSWCPECSRKITKRPKLKIEDLKAIATKRGGKLISKNYTNSATAHQWECSLGHRWLATPSNIKAGKWCKKCSYAKGWKKRKKILRK